MEKVLPLAYIFSASGNTFSFSRYILDVFENPRRVDEAFNRPIRTVRAKILLSWLVNSTCPVFARETIRSTNEATRSSSMTARNIRACKSPVRVSCVSPVWQSVFFFLELRKLRKCDKKILRIRKNTGYFVLLSVRSILKKCTPWIRLEKQCCRVWQEIDKNIIEARVLSAIDKGLYYIVRRHHHHVWKIENASERKSLAVEKDGAIWINGNREYNEKDDPAI